MLSDLLNVFFSDMDSHKELQSLTLKRNPSSHQVCPNPKCISKYNNKYVPPNCYDCGTFMGGSFKKKEEDDEDTKMLTSTICSVRLRARGVAKRVFVDLLEETVRYIFLS